MATIRKHHKKWQGIVRVIGHPVIAQSFKSKIDANRWANLLEVKLRREDSGIAKIKFPKFENLARRYIEEISVLKKCYKDERSKILQFINESWAIYPVNRILPHTLNKWKDNALKTLAGGSVNRKLDVISSMYTTFKRDWGYPVDNPVLQIRRPKKAPPKDFFEKLLPLPKNKYNHSKPQVKLPPLKYEYLPMEFDVEPVKPKKEIKRPKAEGIVSVLNFNRIG